MWSFGDSKAACGVDIHINDERALYIVCGKGHIDVVKYLVSQGSDMHVDAERLLINACYEGHIEVVKYLLSQGADMFVARIYINRFPSTVSTISASHFTRSDSFAALQN